MLRKFRTKEARQKYNSRTPILKKAGRDGAAKTTIEMLKRFQRRWLGK
mgnify:CR=1 FL=1